jgi:hypothetical protein
MVFESKIFGIAACEIEELLFPSGINEVLVDVFFNKMKDQVKIEGKRLSKEEKDMQIYIASHKGLLKSDETKLFYNIWLFYYPFWEELDTLKDDDVKRLEEISEKFFFTKRVIEEQVKHPLQSKLAAKFKNEIIYFLTIMGLIERHGIGTRKIFNNEPQLTEQIKLFMMDKYKGESMRVGRVATRAIIYILITKIILAFVLELPYDAVVIGSVNYLALGINVAFHPMLLLFMVKTTIKNGVDNTNRIIHGVTAIVYAEEEKPLVVVNVSKRKNMLLYSMFVIYGIIFSLSFGGILTVLNYLGFNMVGMILFIFFLTLVSFVGLRIRYMAKMWTVKRDDEKFLPFLLDIFTLPIISLGRWMSNKFSSINIFVFIMDFIIETPFKAILRVLDSFASFVKEKKEEIY